MRTKRIKIYTFEELSEEAQQKAIEKLWDINIDTDWWEQTYDDAVQWGLKIKGFDIDRGSYCNLEFIWDALEVAKSILENHGEMCDTYKASKQLIDEYTPKYNEIWELTESDYDLEAELQDIKDIYLNELSECYLKQLRDEYEYLSSEQAIKETIIANELEFLSDGTEY